MKNYSEQGWWIVSVVDVRTLRVVSHSIDAVFAAGADEAHDIACSRNLRRVHQVFAIVMATPWQRRMAVRLNESRTGKIHEFEELMAE